MYDLQARSYLRLEDLNVISILKNIVFNSVWNGQEGKDFFVINICKFDA